MSKEEQIKALVTRLNANHSAIDSALESLEELYGESVKETHAYLELAGELVENEELLTKLI